MEVIIIDRISYEWEGAGGILDVHSAMPGNSFTNWNKITPRHNAFVQRILQSPCHVYQDMPFKIRKDLPKFPLLDSQLNLVVKDYYSDKSFCRDQSGNINLWKLYNLFSGANKMRYIDTFRDREVGCSQFVDGLYQAIGANQHHWFVS